MAIGDQPKPESSQEKLKKHILYATKAVSGLLYIIVPVLKHNKVRNEQFEKLAKEVEEFMSKPELELDVETSIKLAEFIDDLSNFAMSIGISEDQLTAEQLTRYGDMLEVEQKRKDSGHPDMSSGKSN